jgi:hypothetical protein
MSTMMVDLETARLLSQGGLPGVIAKAKALGGEAFAERAIERLLETIVGAAIAELGRPAGSRAR